MGTEREAEAAGRSLRTPANQEGGEAQREQEAGWQAAKFQHSGRARLGFTPTLRRNPLP